MNGSKKLLRNIPRLGFSGLTIILSNPSRLDSARLLSGNGGMLMNDYCLRPEFNLMQCDVRLYEDTSPLLPDTKCILICGEYALHSLIPTTKNNTLNELRGSVLSYRGIPAIASYFPQDAADVRALEQTNNILSPEFREDYKEENEDAEDYDAVKKHGKTKRANYAFWLKNDVKKCKYILKNGVPKYEEPKYITFP